MNVSFQYASESDPGPYPFGADTPIEGGQDADGDRHALMVDPTTCTLYELYDAHYSPGGSTAGSGAIWNLRSNALRPAGWTSADAAGLPILPGLLRYDEVQSGQHHPRHPDDRARRRTRAISGRRATRRARAPTPTCRPWGPGSASRQASTSAGSPRRPRWCSGPCSSTGSSWPTTAVTGTSGARPTRPGRQSLIHELKQVPASAFEAVDESSLMVSPDSGQARASPGLRPGSRHRLRARGTGSPTPRARLRRTTCRLRLHGRQAAQRPDQPHRLDPRRQGLLAGGRRRRDLRLRRRRLLRVHGGQPLNAPVVNMAPTPDGKRLLARGERRRHLRLRRRPLLRVDGRPAPEPARRGHGGRRRAPGATGWWRPTAASSPSARPSSARPAACVSSKPVNGMAAAPGGTGTGSWPPTAASSLRRRGLLGQHRRHPLERSDHGHGPRRRYRGLLAGRIRRRGLLLQRPLLRRPVTRPVSPGDGLVDDVSSARGRGPLKCRPRGA